MKSHICFNMELGNIRPSEISQKDKVKHQIFSKVEIRKTCLGNDRIKKEYKDWL